MLSLLGLVLVTCAFAHLAAVLALAALPGLTRRLAAVPVLVGAGVAVGVSTLLLPGRPIWPGLVAGVLLAGTCAAWVAVRPALDGVGAVCWISWLAFSAAAATWGAMYLARLQLSAPTSALLWSTVAVAAITMPSAVVTTKEGWEPLLRRQWRRPRGRLACCPYSHQGCRCRCPPTRNPQRS